MDRFLPTFDDFKKNFDAGKTQLVWTWVPADLETPLSAFLKLTRDQKHSFLLESVEGGAVLGRYSAIGFNPDLVWDHKHNSNKEALTKIRTMRADSKIDILAEDMPPMASSGLFGYMGYGMVRLAEDIPNKNPDTLGIPDSVLIRPTSMAIFDNVQSRICLSTPIRTTEGNARDIYDTAIRKLETMIDSLSDPIPSTALHFQTKLQAPLPVTESMAKTTYFDMVRKAIDYIRAGEIFQVVLGLSYSIPFDLPALSLYRSLRRTNPSPFLFYMNYGEFQLVGSSPEILVRVRDKRVTIRPIAGTRKRGKNAAEDNALAAELLADPKERAEHLMLLDLGRNDVGRVAKNGTVNVTDKFFIERYSHVMHIVSNVEGTLREDLDSLDALFAGFPAGTVSGAPKVRAMEIIDELEPTQRSYYGGCVGYLSGNGDMDTCIALRTSVVKDGHIHVQASAGIVADSVAESEYQECLNKSQAIVSAAGQAVEQAIATQRQTV